MSGAAVASRVRPMCPEDIAAVSLLAAEEPTAPHWPVAEYHRLLKVVAERPERRAAWVLLVGMPARSAGPPALDPASHRKPIAAVGIAAYGAESLRGFAMASHVAGICDLEAVVVQAAWRGQRLGSTLVAAAAAWGAGLGASRMELEVRASNLAALRLYGRMGFIIDGRRPGYYQNPDEEAVLMSLQL